MFEEINERHIKLKTFKNKNHGKALEKWPICAVFGEPVTKEQADEIIRRTDDFFSGWGGNDHEFCEKARKILGLPYFYDGYFTEDNEEWELAYARYEADRDAFREKWGVITLYHVCNEWISTCNGNGASGWCHPDGTIEYSQNVGKWPTIEDILEDLTKIAEAFPFLHFFCTLINHNYDYESNKLDAENPESYISFEVKDGTVGILSNAIPADKALGYTDYKNLDSYPTEETRKLGHKAGHRGWPEETEGIYPLKKLKKWKKQNDKRLKAEAKTNG